MVAVEVFPLWDCALEAAKQGKLTPLIEALRSDEPMPRRVRERLAQLLSQVATLKFKRPAHRPRTVGAAARFLMRLGKADGLSLWAADRDVNRIVAAWKNSAAARDLAASDPDLWAAASQTNIPHTSSKAVELAAAYRNVDQQKLINYRRRGRKDRRRS
jgi:hypothetical protein